MENGVSGVPSSTSHQGATGPISQSQFYTPVAAQLGIRRRAVFNNGPAKCIFLYIFILGMLLGPARAGLGILESVGRRALFGILEYLTIITDVVIAVYMNAYRHTTVLIVWSTLTFISFAQLMNDIIGYWQFTNYTPKKDTLEVLYFLGFYFFIFYHGIVFLALAIYLVHVVHVYKENERIRREEGGLPPP